MSKFLYTVLTHVVDVTDLIPSTSESFKVCNAFFKIDPLVGKTKYLCIEHDEKKQPTYLAENAMTCRESLEITDGDNKLIQIPFVTFIIPTMNRPSLVRSIQSLKELNSKLWKAIVVFDGVESTLKPSDMCDQITIMQIEKTGFKNCAGQVRNKGIVIADTEWIAFLDDDDILTPDYIFRLQQEIDQHKTCDVILFRMLSMNQVLPPHPQVSLNSTGISFAMKTHLCQKQGFLFEPSPQEDFQMLNRLSRHGKSIWISDFICYIARPEPL